MTVRWTWSGGQTDEGFRVTASLEGTSTSCRLVASLSSALTSPTYGPSAAVDTNGYCKLSISGLSHDMRYYYGVEVDGVADSWRGQCRTLPPDGTAASFRVCFSSCSITQSVSPVWQAIAARDPLMFIHMGDWGYFDITTDDQDAFRTQYELGMSCQPRRYMMRDVAMEYMYDNHDFGSPNGSGADASRPAISNVYRQIVPSYDLPAGDGDYPVYHDFRIGRIPFIVTDLRHERSAANDPDGPTKTMLGTTQKAWFKQKMLDYKAAGAPVVFWVSTDVWHDDGGAAWGNFATERDEIAEWVESNGMPPVVILSGDAHQVSYQKGVNFTVDGRAFPEHVASALDQSSLAEVSGPEGWTAGPFLDLSGQLNNMYSMLEVHDSGGDQVWWTVTGWRDKFAGYPAEHLYSVDSRSPDDAPTLSLASVSTFDGSGWVNRDVLTNASRRPVYMRTLA